MDALAPRSHRHKAERCRQLWLAARAVANAGLSDRPRWQLAALSACAAAAGNGTFFRNALDSCERLMRTPSRASISAPMRAIVQFGRLATGSSRSGATTRKAVSLFTGDGPGATLAFNASVPPRLKSLRHSRTVSSRTLNASAMHGLVQPESVSRIARALSASPRSREPAKAAKAERRSSPAETGDLPLMPHLCESIPVANRTPIRWSSPRSLLSPLQ
jgi:hypothetical protein